MQLSREFLRQLLYDATKQNYLNGCRAVLTFGLNALSGRKKANQDPKDTLYIGNWNPSYTRAFMQYILSKGQKIDSWEFDNHNHNLSS